MFDALRHDIRFAARLIRRQPLLAAAAALTVAFGVGANTAIVSVLETVLLNPLGLSHSTQVMVARVSLAKLNMDRVSDSGVEFREIQSMSDAFSATAAMESRAWTSEVNGEASRLLGQAVTPDFFRVFGEEPAIGRFLLPEDRESIVLSNGFWRTAFGGDTSVLGRALVLDGKPYRVVGVAQPGFRFPANAQAWIPLVLAPDRLQRRGYNMSLSVFARLRDGLSPAQSQDRVARYVAGLKANPGGADLAKIGYNIDLDPFSVYVAGDLRRPLMLLWCAAVVVLFAGCANVAGLLLTRGANRKREMAIRLAVGATRRHIIGQLLMESVLLGLMGGLGGLVMAALAVPLTTHLAIPGKQVLALVAMDRRVLLYGLALALSSGLIFGLAPAVQLLRDGQAGEMARSRRRWFQDVFVTAQVAGAFVLVVLAALLVRSLWAVEQVRPGFDPQHITTAYLIKPRNDPSFIERLEATLSAAPGVQSAALAYPVPFSGGGLTSGFQIQNRKPLPGEPEWHGEAYFVSPRYFETLRIPLLRGRGLSEGDSATAPLVCVVDSKLADRFFPKQDPIGQSIAMYQGYAQIVGVVGAIRGTTLEGGSRPVIYYSLVQVPFFAQAAAVVRSGGPAGPMIREAVRHTNASAPVFDIRTMEDRIAESLGIRRVMVTLLSVFGGISLLLAAIGLYGVIAQVVGERTQEIGVRVALGARPGQILAHFMRQGLRSGLLGLALGLLAAAYVQKWLAGMLYEVRAFDPETFVAAGASVFAVLVFSVWWPARRASRIQPQQALRHE